MTRTNILSLLIVLTFFFSCSDDEKNNKPREWNIQGKVEKGPFVKGSTVDIQELNESLSPTGRSFTTTIIDDEGNFNLNNITLESPYVLLKAEGYFFNEVNGDLSNGQITLQALSDLSDGTSININILTHLKKDRLIQLIKQDKLSYKEANTQVQKELLTSFGLQKYAEKEFNTYSITAGTNESGALIVVSATLLNGRSEAKLTEYMASISEDLKVDGKLSDQHKEDIWDKSTQLNVTSIANNIVERYKSLNKDVNVPDLSYFIDWDRDGIAGNEFGGGNKDLSFEMDTLKVGKEGGIFKVKVNSQIKYKVFKMDNISEGTYDWGLRKPEFKSTISDNDYLELTIEPAKSILMTTDNVIITSLDEQTSATLCIAQEGDFNKEIASNDVKNLYANILLGMRNSFYQNYLMEAFYSQSFNNYENKAWEVFFNHELDSYNSTVAQAWELAYKALPIMRTYKQLSEQNNVELGLAAFTNLEAIVYYQLAILWSNVPYVKDNGIDAPINQMKEKDLFALFEDQLLRCIELFPAKKNNNLIFVSKDTPRAVLAKMYIQTGEYTKALGLLNDIINNGDYNIEPSREKACGSNSQELIFSLIQDGNSDYCNLILRSDRFPVFTYTDIVLSAAECEIHTGNKSKATDLINTIRNKRGKESIDTNNVEAALTTTWEEELKGFFSYFAYLKRNNLAESKLNIETYQKIFPIPERETYFGINQNPGYLTK